MARLPVYDTLQLLPLSKAHGFIRSINVALPLDNNHWYHHWYLLYHKMDLMKLATTLILFALLTGCTGCESTEPSPIKLPPLPVEAPVIEVEITPVTKFKIGDKITLISPDGKTKVDGVIVEIGPVGLWVNSNTNEERTGRVCIIEATVDGKTVRGPVPEFALTKR